MENQILDISGNLLFCADGSVWAVWRAHPRESARSTGKQLHELYSRTVTFMKSLRGEVMLASLCEQVQPHAIIRRCLDGVDLDGNPRWAETVHNAWDQLDDLDVLGRSYWIAKPLAGHGWRDGGRALLRAAGAALSVGLGIPPRPASPQAVAEAQELARVIQGELGGAIRFVPRPRPNCCGGCAAHRSVVSASPSSNAGQQCTAPARPCHVAEAALGW